MEVYVEKGNCRGKWAKFAYVDDSVERQLARLKIQEMIMGLDTRDVDISRWYDLTTTNAVSLKFYGNTRIDVKFKDSAAAESCFKRLRLNEIKLRDEN